MLIVFSGLADLSAAELELVVLCKLEQSEIARLKHHAPMAARIVLSSLRLLQSSNLFKKKKDIPAQRRSVSLYIHFTVYVLHSQEQTILHIFYNIIL